MFLLLDEIPNLKAAEEEEIQSIAFFTAFIYTKWLLKAEIPVTAPSQVVF